MFQSSGVLLWLCRQVAAGSCWSCCPAPAAHSLPYLPPLDLSRNRFPEVPEAACQLVSLEGLSLYHNCLRCLNPALGNLTALTYLNLRWGQAGMGRRSLLWALRVAHSSESTFHPCTHSRNQLSSLPPYICQLPLRVLIVSNNKLGTLPPDISALGSLRQLVRTSLRQWSSGLGVGLGVGPGQPVLSSCSSSPHSAPRT